MEHQKTYKMRMPVSALPITRGDFLELCGEACASIECWADIVGGDPQDAGMLIELVGVDGKAPEGFDWPITWMIEKRFNELYEEMDDSITFGEAIDMAARGIPVRRSSWIAFIVKEATPWVMMCNRSLIQPYTPTQQDMKSVDWQIAEVK